MCYFIFKMSTDFVACLRFRECSEILYYVYVGTLLVTYTPLIGLIQVKFQNGNMSPFKTHSFFMIISVVALVMATLTLRILFYINSRFENECSSPIHHIILINIAWFSTLLAPLSLVLVLFIPTKLIWIGYSIVCALFLAIVACNFIGRIYLLGKLAYATTLKRISYFQTTI